MSSTRSWLGLLAASAVVGYHVSRLRSDWAHAQRIAKEHPGDEPRLSQRPRVSILVAAWNERGMIARHIKSVMALTYSPLEYVLCAGGDDGTYEVAQETLTERGVLIRQEPGEGKQRALRRALAQASGEIIVLTDADCLLDESALLRLIEPIVSGAPASTGRSRPLLEQIERQPYVLCQWAPQYAAETRVGDRSYGLLGRNCAVRRDALAVTGDFQADVATGTDNHLARALYAKGMWIAFARWSFVRTEMPTTPGTYIRQQARWLKNHWVHADAADSAARRHAALTWASGLAFVVLPALAALSSRLSLAIWMLLFVHGALARLRYVLFVTRAEGLDLRPGAFFLAPFWFAIDAVAWARSFLDVVVPTRRRVW